MGACGTSGAYASIAPAPAPRTTPEAGDPSDDVSDPTEPDEGGAATGEHTPRVSVAMVTFRHERWIGEAIESVLAQDFEDWELVIGDDMSDDRTVEVARSYEERCVGPHGPRLRILPHDAKVGPRPNFMRILRACRGEYIAHLDGDDFFVDPGKLTKQVAFLDANPDHAGVFGAWLETDQDGENGVLTPGFGIGDQTRFTASDFGAYCKTTSCVVMFRRGLFGDFPDWYMEAAVGDWPLHVLNLAHGGDYGYLPDVLAAHRNHGDGVWTKRSQADQARSTIHMHDLFLREFPPDLAGEMLPKMVRSNFGRGRKAHRQGDDEAARVFLEWCHAHRTPNLSRFKLWRTLRRVRRRTPSE